MVSSLQWPTKRKSVHTDNFKDCNLSSLEEHAPECMTADVRMGGGKDLIFSDIQILKDQINIKLGRWLALIYLLHNSSYFRSLFYYRIGPARALMISWLRPANPYFNISYTTKIGGGFKFFHPFSTVINAERIGNNFTCLQCTTLGSTSKGRPIIGNNVILGANVTIIGNVKIGNNVTIGAGAVVVKNIPDNAIAVGNPAKVIRFSNNDA